MLVRILFYHTWIFLIIFKTVNTECVRKPNNTLKIISPDDFISSSNASLFDCQDLCDKKVYFRNCHQKIKHNFQLQHEECSFFLSKANNCTLYKGATVTASVTTPESYAGICPKYDSSQYDSYSNMPVPGNYSVSWCAEASGDICTFPFSLKITGLHYKPYKDDFGEWCGTKSNNPLPIEYLGVYELESAILCISE